MSAAGPTVGWSWYLNSVNAIDDYHAIDKYGRWVFNYTKRSSSAKYSYKTEPSSRFKNTSGNMIIEDSHAITWWDQWYGSTYVTYTGVYQWVFPDL